MNTPAGRLWDVDENGNPKTNFCGFDEVWLVGEAFAKTEHGQRTFVDVEAVKNFLQESIPEGYYILIKGSNRMKLASLVSLL